VSRGTSNAQKEEEEEGSEDEDVTMADDLAQKPKPKKRKQKKVIPLGHNGLKKKRVVKSRTTVDAKGYMGKVLSFLHYSSLTVCHLPSHRGLLLIRVC